MSSGVRGSAVSVYTLVEFAIMVYIGQIKLQ